MILKVLREATASAHARVEGLVPVMDPNLTREKYLWILERFYSLYGPLEKEIERATARSLHAAEAVSRQKIQWLIDDLLALGMSVQEIGRIQPVEAPPILTLSHAMGALYVTEGATLGAQHIVERLRRDRPEFPRRFFTGYGEETGRRWNHLRETLQSIPAPDHPAVLEGALATFDCFEKTFAVDAVAAESVL